MTARDDLLASPHAAVLYLIQMDFLGGTQRFTNWSHNLDWAGQTWVGLGSILGVSAITQSERMEYPAVEIALNVSNRAHLALALGGAAQYRKRPITIYQCLLDDEFRAVGEPELAWAGEMDQVRLKTGDGEKDDGAVAMRCELPGRDTRGPQTLRLNNAQHQARHSGDTFLSRVEKLSGQPVTWLTKRFQHRD